MEKYVNSCKFIFICDQLSKVNEPIRSRCLLIRVPLPEDYKIFEVLLNISLKEKINISYHDLASIVRESNGRVKQAIWFLELKRMSVEPRKSWRILLNEIVDEIINPDNYKCDKIKIVLKKVEAKMYLLFITNIDTQKIITELMRALLKITDSIEIKFQIIEITSIFEKRIATGTRHILHLRAYAIRVMYLLTKFYYGKCYNYKLNELEV